MRVNKHKMMTCVWCELCQR